MLRCDHSGVMAVRGGDEFVGLCTSLDRLKIPKVDG